MSSAATLNAMRPGFRLNHYPERAVKRTPEIEARARGVACGWQAKHSRRQLKRVVTDVKRAFDVAEQMDASTFDEHVLTLRDDLRRDGWSHNNLMTALAAVGVRVQQTRGFTPHPEQYFGAWVLLQGQLAEMATGEGKTIMAAIAASVAGLSGTPVHVVTSNDYLVERDAMSSVPLFETFSLSTGFVVGDMDDDRRRAAYASDICYVSNKQLVFDYLRDRQSNRARPASIGSRIGRLTGLTTVSPFLRGLCFAIVDEADSALIDDAITPLILSHQEDANGDLAQAITALSLARRMRDTEHYEVDMRTRRVTLTNAGDEHLTHLSSGLQGKWPSRRFRRELARQALAALFVFQRDVDYLIRDDEVVLIDQATGRLMADRKLQHGLHQMIEAKEQCELSGASRTIASLSFQNFFVRYQHLAGMTGTATEAANELRTTYRLGVVQIPTNKPSRRKFSGASFASTDEHYGQLLVDAVASRVKRGQPVLVGTRSLEHSEKIAELLRAQEIPHQILNARQDETEAAIVAGAGRPRVVTIATNMAGRGTDIPIDPLVSSLGGLHVIVSQFNDSRRIDRQLIGRCARQGDPGSYEFIIAPDDQVMHRGRPPEQSSKSPKSWLIRRLGDKTLQRRARRSQAWMERNQRALRKQVANSDRSMRKSLTYTGYKE